MKPAHPTRSLVKQTGIVRVSAALAAVALVTALSLSGCFKEGCVNCPPLIPSDPTYFEPTSPENLIHNLQEAYYRKEIEPYADILAPDFAFKFQPIDVQELNIDQLNQDQDSTGTHGLFASPLVGDIRIDLIYGPSAETGESFPGVEGEIRTVRINPAHLEVDVIGGEFSGTTYFVDGTVQDMFFRRGNAAAGEDPDRWFLFEWREVPVLPQAAPGPGTDFAAGPVSVKDVSWGDIKGLYTP